MNGFKKLGAIIFLSAYLIISPASTLVSLAADPVFTPQIGVPNSEFKQQENMGIGTTNLNSSGETVMRSDLLARYITAFYNWGLSIVGVIAVLVLMAAGALWITSGGDSGKIGTAKKLIEGSLTGSALLVASWFLLNTINPNLTKLPAMETVIIKQVTMGCCDAAKDDGTAKMTGSNNCKDGAAFDLNKMLISGKCEAALCCVLKNNITNNTRCLTAFSNSCTLLRGEGAGTEANCSDVTECSNPGAMINCNTADGEWIEGNVEKNTFTCYHEKVYPAFGAELSEPCGVQKSGHGLCVKSETPCNDRNNMGGRRCGDNLKCCLD